MTTLVAGFDWRQVAAAQDGVLSRAQAIECGLSPSYIRSRLQGDWRTVHAGVYVTFTGPLLFRTRVWAAVLYAGPGATASHETAAWLQGLIDRPPSAVDVSIPHKRKVRRQPGIRLHRRVNSASVAHPARLPPQTRLEVTVLDLVHDTESVGLVIDVVLRACQRRLTNAARLAAAAGRMRRLRWRHLLCEVLDDVADGVASPLERRWRRDVEQPHGLPKGQRNKPEAGQGRRRYRDVRYRSQGVVVELDGRAAHPDEERHRDHRRDNAVAVEGAVGLRYGWHDVAGSPCEAAIEVAVVLRRRGWVSPLRPCGPDCPAGRESPG